MFNLLISANETAWETDQLMRMDATRFGEYSGGEAELLSPRTPDSLKVLENTLALLMYETGIANDVVRLGALSQIRVSGGFITFLFTEHGRFTRENVAEFGDRLQISRFEYNRTHWAVKDGAMPRAFLDKLVRTPARYDVVLSFAGEDRDYVQQVADHLKAKGVNLFYDRFEEADLWGKDLAEHFDFIYRNARFCVMFISNFYADKMWTRHERRTALVRALEDRREYILPVRFDESEVPGIRPTVGYISAKAKLPEELAEMIAHKLKSVV